MARLLDTLKMFSQSHSQSSPGGFATDVLCNSSDWEGYPIQFWPGWTHCREVFQLQFTLDQEGFWYFLKRGELDAVIEFMTYIERMLGITADQETTFQQAGKERRKIESGRLFFVTPSPFWKADDMRKNMLTLFLRVARIYANQDGERSFIKAMEEYEYTNKTKPALERFFLGFTKYVGPDLEPVDDDSTYISMGWFQQFAGLDSIEVKSLLKLPQNKCE